MTTISEELKRFALRYDKQTIKEAVMRLDSGIDPYLRLLLLQINKDDENCAVLLANDYYEGNTLIQDRGKALSCLQKAASNGNAKAMYQIAWHYYDNQEFSRAIDAFNKCIEHKNQLEDYELGQSYATAGDSYLRLSKPDFYKAVEYLTIAIDKYHNSYAGYRLGNIYAEENSPVHDPVKAIRILNSAASEGEERAVISLVEGYLFGDDNLGLQRNKQKALELLQPYMNNTNNVQIMVLIGRLYMLNDDSIPSDYEKAVHYLRMALGNNDFYKAGYIESLLGYSLYLNFSEKEGAEYLTKAYDEGFYDFCALLGNYYYGDYYNHTYERQEANYDLACMYYKKAYEIGNINLFQCCNYIDILTEKKESLRDYLLAYEVAEYGLNNYNDIEFVFIKAKLVLTGKVSGKTTVYDALQMMERAATFDYLKLKASVILADYYLSVNDYRKGESYLLAAYEEGDSDSALKLARMYEKGAGTIQASVSKGVEWYKKAAEAGSEIAKEELTCFTEKLFGGYKRVRNL